MQDCRHSRQPREGRPPHAPRAVSEWSRSSPSGVLMAMAGVLIVISGGDAGRLLSAGFGTGEVLMVGAVVVWTAYTVIGRLAPKIPPITATAVQAAAAVALLAPVRFLTGGLALPSTGSALASLLFIAVFPSVLSYLLWNRALPTTRPDPERIG